MSTLEHVTATAVWGSLIGSAFLCAYMCVQALTDPPRRARFALFALLTGLIAALDFARPHLGLEAYESVRLVLWSYYGASVVGLHGHGLRAVLASALVPGAIGTAVWLAGWRDLATTATLPPALAIAAAAHGVSYVRARGYASIVLAGTTTAMALACALYFAVVSSGRPEAISLGYAHWAFLSVVAVLFGWIHLPREMRGLAPVRVDPPLAAAAFAGIVGGELAVVAGLLAFRWPPTVYLAGNLMLALGCAVLFLHHRHRLVIHTDTTAELARQLEDKTAVIERQRRLELAAQTAGQAAHDIQNVLAPVLTDLTELQRLAIPRVTAIARRIHARVDDLLELNGQLLCLARRGRLELHPVRLAEVVDDARARFPAVEVAHDGDAWIRGSWSQLSRAVANLTANALEAGTRVRVRTGLTELAASRRCHLGFLEPGRHAFLEVADDGPGIPAACIDRIFEPFFSLKPAGPRSGSGLGLSIVAAVVDDMRGVLDLATAPGRTVFTMYFAPVPAPGGAAEPLGGTGTVVVADDDPATRDWCAGVLRDAGYTVLTAASGEEAVHHVQTGRVDALLLDLRMPRLSGYETFFAAMHVHPRVRAVAYSSYIGEEDTRQLGTLGVTEMLAKPASRREILLAMRRVLAR